VELRHLHCFLAVAEELHFGRAAERLHIEQSPLSRAIKDLEEDLGVPLFVRTTRCTRLTPAGKRFLEHVRRVLLALKQARESVATTSQGFDGQLRIALSDCATPSSLPALLALSREEEPDTEIRLFEVTLAQQIKGLHGDLYDAGFALSREAGDGIIAEPVWCDPLMVLLPARHPLLVHKHIPLEEVLHYPLVLNDSEVCEGYARQVDRVLQRGDQEPIVAERVTSFDLMSALVSAGFALGLAAAPQIAASREHGVVMRPLAGRQPMLTTYLLRLDAEPSPMLARFIERLASIGSNSAHRPTSDPLSDAQKEIEP